MCGVGVHDKAMGFVLWALAYIVMYIHKWYSPHKRQREELTSHTIVLVAFL